MTPQPYLSYSQKRLWKSSPKAYMDRYLNGKKFTSRNMAYGKTIDKAIETGELTGEADVDVLLLDIPRFEIMQYELHVDLKQGKEIVPLLAKMDTAREDLSGFKDHKTGIEPWTQRKVDEDEQLTFYATCCWLKTHKIPNDIELVHIVTQQDPETLVISCTGEIRRYHTKRTMTHVLNEIVDIRKVWREINEAYEKELI